MQIKTITKFLRLLQDASDDGFAEGFVLMRNAYTPTLRPDYMKRFGAMYWKSPSTSLWSPASVIWIHNNPRTPILEGPALQKMFGMDDDKWKAIQKASDGTIPHSKDLRLELLHATYLIDNFVKED